jgi:VanZ family protein
MSPSQARRLSTRLLIAAIVYAALIFAVSQIPGKELARLGFKLWDKAIHALEYLPLGAVIMAWLQARRAPNDRSSWVRDFAIATGLVLCYGALDELHQAFVPGRQSSIGDATADLIGGTIGVLATLFYRRRSAGRGHEPLDEFDAREENQPVELVARDPGNLDDRRDGE